MMSCRPIYGVELLATPDYKYSWQKLLQHLRVNNLSAGWKGLGKACETYVLAAGVLNVQAAPAHSLPVAIAPQEGSSNVLAKAPETNSWDPLRELASAHERMQEEEHQWLQINSLEGHQCRCIGVWDGAPSGLGQSPGWCIRHQLAGGLSASFHSLGGHWPPLVSHCHCCHCRCCPRCHPHSCHPHHGHHYSSCRHCPIQDQMRTRPEH